MTDMDIYVPENEGKTEKATPGKIKKAREEGYVAKSAELTAVASVLGAVAFVAFFGRHILESLKSMIRTYIGLSMRSDIADGATYAAAVDTFCSVLLPFLAVVFAVALAAELAQTGFHASWKPLWFDLNRLRRRRSSVQAGFKFGHALIKVVAVALILFIGIRSDMDSIYSGFFVVKMLVYVASVLLVLAVVDYIFAIKFHADSLKMTRHEVLEEMKQENGDHMVKDRLYEQK